MRSAEPDGVNSATSYDGVIYGDPMFDFRMWVADAGLEGDVIATVGKRLFFTHGERANGGSKTYNENTSSHDAANEAYYLISGRLRGRVPYPVPGDILAVLSSFAGRIYASRANAGTMQLRQGKLDGTIEIRDPMQLSMMEMSVLNRYRRTTG